VFLCTRVGHTKGSLPNGNGHQKISGKAWGVLVRLYETNLHEDLLLVCVTAI
jgi:hypothetical protein